MSEALKSQLAAMSAAIVVVLLSDLREEVGNDLATIREYTVEPYRDEYLQHDTLDGLKEGRPRKVRVHRAQLLESLTPKLAGPVAKAKAAKEDPAPAAVEAAAPPKSGK